MGRDNLKYALPIHRHQTAQDTRTTGAVQLVTTHRFKGLELRTDTDIRWGGTILPLAPIRRNHQGHYLCKGEVTYTANARRCFSLIASYAAITTATSSTAAVTDKLSNFT